MTTTVEQLTEEHWIVFDDFVQQADDDNPYEIVAVSLLSYYRELRHAGLMERGRGILSAYRLTDAGRRAVCQRDGQHDHDRKRPADDGCRTCDAALCPTCSGYGSLSDPRGERADVACGDCDETGLTGA